MSVVSVVKCVAAKHVSAALNAEGVQFSMKVLFIQLFWCFKVIRLNNGTFAVSWLLIHSFHSYAVELLPVSYCWFYSLSMCHCCGFAAVGPGVLEISVDWCMAGD